MADQPANGTEVEYVGDVPVYIMTPDAKVIWSAIQQAHIQPGKMFVLNEQEVAILREQLLVLRVPMFRPTSALVGVGGAAN